MSRPKKREIDPGNVFRRWRFDMETEMIQEFERVGPNVTD
jgi:hypothetical protein